jgi:hypothetical protein
MTEVSINPRRARASRTRCRILTQVPIDVSTKTLGRDCWRTLECGNRGFCRDELAAQRLELANRHTMTRNHETLTPIEGTHDLAAFVSELALSNLA